MIFFYNLYECNNNSYVNTDKTNVFKVKHAHVPLNYWNIYLKSQGVLQVNNLGQRNSADKVWKTPAVNNTFAFMNYTDNKYKTTT